MAVPLFCSALNSSSCHKIANKMTKSIIFFTNRHDCVIDIHKEERDGKKRCGGAKTKFHWLLFECAIEVHAVYAILTGFSVNHIHVMHFIRNYDHLGEKGVICIIIYVIKTNLCAREPNYIQQLVDLTFKCNNFRYNTALSLALLIALFRLNRTQ